MNAVAVEKKEDGTLVLKIKVPASFVEKTRQEVVVALTKHVSAPGFRKGKTPKHIAEAKIPRETVREEVLKKVITESYNDAVAAEKLAPITTPRIHVEMFDEGTDLEFTAETAEAPHIALGNYKDEVGKVTAKSKIIIPGKENENNKPKLDEILDTVLKSIQIRISKVLIDQEAGRLLSQLLDELKTLGLSLDQYLSSRTKSAEELRREYEERAERDLKLEFLLRTIADAEKITVEARDIDEALTTIQDEKQRAELAKNPYLLAGIIRQQKTIDFLTKI